MVLSQLFKWSNVGKRWNNSSHATDNGI